MLRLREGFTSLVVQEAGDQFHSNVKTHLRRAVSDAMQSQGKWGYYVDHNGDGESGDCIYEADGQHFQCPYEIQRVGEKYSANLDTANAERVTPMVNYGKMAGPDDYYTSMQEGFVRSKLYTELPLYERYISKAERDKASDEDFAGKNRSFPILKPADVSAAVHAMGRAGADNHGPAKLKANIIAIAKRKGWEDELPKAWRSTSTSEAGRGLPAPIAASNLRLVEGGDSCCLFLEEIPLTENAGAPRSSYPIKIISPGTGSSAHYPASVIEQAASVFKKGTLMFWNHQTAQEAAQRPEGDLDQLAAIMTSDARWDQNGVKGPGLYAEAKPMADYAEKIASRAPHIGLSIRAGGTIDGAKKVDGKPVLKSIDYVESVDYVTRAGRGGLALAEAARDAGITPLEETEDMGMTLKEAQDLVARATAPLILSNLKREGREEAMRILEAVSLPHAAKGRIADSAIGLLEAEGTPLVKDGVLQLDKFREAVVTQAKAEGRYIASLTGGGDTVRGLGGAPAFDRQLTEAELKEQRKAEKRARKNSERLGESGVTVFSRLMGGNKDAARAAYQKGRAA